MDSEIQEIIRDCQSNLTKNFKTILSKFNLSDESMKLSNFTTIRSYEEYGLNTAPTSHNINSLTSIGWPDPFPFQLELTKKFLMKKTHITPELINEKLKQTIEWNQAINTDTMMFDDISNQNMMSALVGEDS